LVSPKFDLPMKNARWDLYLPPDYDYSRFGGSMARTTETGLPMEQVFSLSEYNVQQRAQEEQSKSSWRFSLESARKDLAGGNLQKAVGSYNRAKLKSAQAQAAQAEGRELEELERDVRRAQSSNLIAAQNNYAYNNLGIALSGKGQTDEAIRQYQEALRLPGAQVLMNAPAQQQQAMPQAFQGRNLNLNYDENVASLQWDKLEKAQQVAVAKVAPLHVNLPTRGVRYSFSQVLQTELRKPMTIHLLAENTKVPSWTIRLLLGVLCFAVLWAIVALFNRRKTA
jgi:tetratricopeptide (TPR) repeat protein